MEVIVRVSEEKYLKSGTVSTIVEATQKIINENCKPLFEKYNQQKWRNEVYWNEPCDECLKYYKVIF